MFVDNLDNLSIEEIVHYADLGLLGLDRQDLIAAAYEEGLNLSDDAYADAFERGYEARIEENEE